MRVPSIIRSSVSLTAGTRLGPYEVSAQIGEGGMGQVYRAHDTQLRRDVALKTLPDFFAHDDERLARFRREAHVLASLNHPGISAQMCNRPSMGEVAPQARVAVTKVMNQVPSAPHFAPPLRSDPSH